MCHSPVKSRIPVLTGRKDDVVFIDRLLNMDALLNSAVRDCMPPTNILHTL